MKTQDVEMAYLNSGGNPPSTTEEIRIPPPEQQQAKEASKANKENLKAMLVLFSMVAAVGLFTWGVVALIGTVPARDDPHRDGHPHFSNDFSTETTEISTSIDPSLVLMAAGIVVAALLAAAAVYMCTSRQSSGTGNGLFMMRDRGTDAGSEATDQPSDLKLAM